MPELAIVCLDLGIKLINELLIFSRIHLRTNHDRRLLRNLKLVIPMVGAQQVNSTKMHIDIPVKEFEIVLDKRSRNRLILDSQLFGGIGLLAIAEVGQHYDVFAHFDQLVDSLRLFLFKQEIKDENHQ